MSEFDDTIAQLLDDGAISEDDAQRLRDASPLRRERDEAKTAAEQARTEAATLRARLAEDAFAKAGVPGKPGAYSLPADLDVTDPAKIAEWAHENGIAAAAQQQQATQQVDADQAAIQRMTQAAQQQAPPAPPAGDKLQEMHARVLNAGPGELQSLYGDALKAIREHPELKMGTVEHDNTFVPLSF